VSTPPERPRGFLINTWIASELVASLLEGRLAEEGVHSGFYGTLSVIGVWGPLTPSKVAELTGAPLTTVSDRLRRMVADGDVERVAHPGDGRSHLVQLTAKGDAHWKQGWPALQRTIAEVTGTSTGPWTRSRARSEDLDALRKAGCHLSGFVASHPVSEYHAPHAQNTPRLTLLIAPSASRLAAPRRRRGRKIHVGVGRLRRLSQRSAPSGRRTTARRP
jgi:DNA-binding MarR family transcriptional regulator